MQISIFTTIAAILSAVTVTAAPTTPKRQEVLGEYTTYSATTCDNIIARETINPASCNGLPSADSIDATFDNAQGYEFRLYFDSDCQDYAQVLPLNTCVNTEDFFSVSLYCIGDVECAAY